MNAQVQRTLTFILIAMVAVLFASQVRSLFIFPQPNSLRWFGDETWLMTEAIQQITTGIVKYPLAIGSTLEHGKGLALSMTWLSALLYGLPAWLAGHDPVAIGRIVTALLAACLLWVLYGSARMLGASRFASSFALLLLVSTRSLFFASHSARPDLLAGLIVLAFVATCTKFVHDGIEFEKRWWFCYGAVVVFLSLSSSIHLLTLLGPVSLFFCWRLGGMKSWNVAATAIAGAAGMAAILIGIYFFTTGNFTLFSSSSGPVQFQDVLSSIPIRRPFSRSVQVSNIVIRFKQFVSEAAQIFLLPILLPFVWRRRSDGQQTFSVATIIVLLSWLLLEGAEISYLMHLLPLLFLWLALAVSEAIFRWKYFGVAILASLTALSFLSAIRDSSSALTESSMIDRPHRTGIHEIESSIASSWHGATKPRVICEPFALDRLSQDTNIEAMTDHFISFPNRSELFDSFVRQEHVNYVVLYNSPVYPKNRWRDDPFYEDVIRSGKFVTSFVGTSGDMGRDYFAHSNWQDTLLLFQLTQ
jgi:hypothetical protein